MFASVDGEYWLKKFRLKTHSSNFRYSMHNLVAFFSLLTLSYFMISQKHAANEWDLDCFWPDSLNWSSFTVLLQDNSRICMRGVQLKVVGQFTSRLSLPWFLAWQTLCSRSSKLFLLISIDCSSAFTAETEFQSLRESPHCVALY